MKGEPENAASDKDCQPTPTSQPDPPKFRTLELNELQLTVGGGGGGGKKGGATSARPNYSQCACVCG